MRYNLHIQARGKIAQSEIIMKLSTSHSAFRDAIVFFGNACTNHQTSVYFAVKDHMPTNGVLDESNGKLYYNTSTGRWYGTTKEKVTEENLKFLRPFLSPYTYKRIIEQALACSTVCAGLIRTKGKRYGYFVMDENGKIISFSCFVNHHKASALVKEFVNALQLDNEKMVTGQIDYVSKKIAGGVEQRDEQQLQTRLESLKEKLAAININRVLAS